MKNQTADSKKKEKLEKALRENLLRRKTSNKLKKKINHKDYSKL